MLHWIDLLWLTMSCVGGLLAVIHLAVALRQREPSLHYGFSVFAASVAISAALEWLLMRASTPAEYATLLRWEIVVFVPLSMALLYIVHALSPGPRWLWVTIVATRIIATIANFTTGDNLAFRETHGLQDIALWGGDQVVRAIGTVNPWVALGQVSNLLLEAFTIVVIVRLFRQPASDARTRKLRILFSALAFMLFATFWHVPFVLLGLQIPVMLSPPFLVFAVVMAYELSGDILRAADMARTLRITEDSLRDSQHSMALAERAAGLGTWCWDLRTNDLKLSPRSLQLLGFAPDVLPTPAMIGDRMEPEDLDRLRRTLTRIRNDSAEEFSAEFRLRVPVDGQRWVAIHGQVDLDAEATHRPVRGVMFDATERHRVDGLFRTVVWASPTALLM
ncbi:MAG TPA: PAS domain-containing protein, partial [Xanthomonadales bacterium]|nr:PAS domain-containing protein [Xanthomonadales bacterium]